MTSGHKPSRPWLFGLCTSTFHVPVLAAVGIYDFTGLLGFNWVLNDGPADAMGLIFSQMTISTGPAP